MSCAAPAEPRRGVRRLIRRIDVRLTFWFSSIFLATALLLFLFTFASLYSTLREEDQRALQSKALGLVVTYRRAANEEAALTALVSQIGAEALSATGTPTFYRIATIDNVPIFRAIPVPEWQAFDFEPLTRPDRLHAEGFVSLSSDRFDYQLEILGVKLSATYVLQIGADTRNRMHVLEVFQRSFLLTFVVMLAVSSVGGLVLTSRSLRPIGSLTTTIRSIVETGELDRRIPPGGSDDDLDDLVRSFNTMVDRVQSLVHGLRDALDAVAHDLRTPITRFRSIAETALERQPDPEAYREALGEALEESERILGMLNAMMEISEAESGALRLRLTETDLGELARQVSEVYALVAEEHDMRIDVITPERVVVQGDASRLRQVVGNLLDNAVKYGDPDTTISVSVEAAGTARLEVANTGPGIPAEELDRVWRRLYRGRSGDRRDGLGLGLALVKAIVEAHGGRASVSSTPGGRTIFAIGLPIDGPSAAPRS